MALKLSDDCRLPRHRLYRCRYYRRTHPGLVSDTSEFTWEAADYSGLVTGFQIWWPSALHDTFVLGVSAVGLDQIRVLGRSAHRRGPHPVRTFLAPW